MKNCIFLLLIVLSLFASGVEPAGPIYWVQFNSKATSPYSLDTPELYLSNRAIERRNKHHIAIDSTDLPVNPSYIDSLTALGFYVKHTSRWMNGAIVIFNDSTSIDSLVLPSFVKFVELRKDKPLKSTRSKFSDIYSLKSTDYGDSYTQISMLGGQILHHFSKGEGVHVAVIDAGFLNVDRITTFDSLRSQNGILGTYDFVSPGNNVYNENSHGTSVLSTMAANTSGWLVGTAPKASYWLLRSEVDSTEYPVEEDYWIIAAEFADSAGCDVINTSLGYTIFDNPAFDHTYDEFDGKTIRISQAANLAVDKGLVVVCSAGNSGNDAWGHIVVPAEAEKVLCVAAVDAWDSIAGFSSRGFSGENFISKPDISAMGVRTTVVNQNGNFVTGNGTSFSSPILAGMAACLVGLYPEKSSVEIMDLIRSLGDRYPEHSLEYGYGIPDFGKLFPDFIDTTITSAFELDELNVQVYPNPFQSTIVISSNYDYNVLEIYNFGGQKVFSTPVKQHDSFEITSPTLSNLTKGVYFARLKGDKKVKSFQLIKN